MTNKSNIFIQWKGTNVCLDFYCKCGGYGHVDEDFVYFLKCDTCGTIYEMPELFTLQEAEPNENSYSYRNPTIVETYETNR